MNPYGFLIPRLDGDKIDKRFEYYADLVRKGIAGFIVFGGDLEPLRKGIKRLQDISGYPLIIASDLESGLGQQVRGGTLFPPSMGIASALKDMEDLEGDTYLKRLYSTIASEAHYVGINTILAPVLDVNSNPENPIIATRSFGEDPQTVSQFGVSMIRVFKECGIISCGKHFPGHGDTDRDSHQELPVINKTLKDLEENELLPFKSAIAAGVDMIMIGHLCVPCLDPDKRPATLSEKVVGYLRDVLGFKGLIITDAMNMGGLSDYSEEVASLMALRAGVDLILHPSDPDSIAGFIKSELPDLRNRRLELRFPDPENSPDFGSNRRFSEELFYRAIRSDGNLKAIENPFMIVLSDEPPERTRYFLDWFESNYGKYLLLSDPQIPWHKIPEKRGIVVSVFSDVGAWKINRYRYFKELFNNIYKKVDVFISFGNPYILRGISSSVIFTYSTSREAQSAMIDYIKDKRLFL